MTYRIVMWIVIALMVAQASLYNLVIFPRYSEVYARYSLALSEAVGAMDDCSNLLDKMDNYIQTNCEQAPQGTKDEISWRIK